MKDPIKSADASGSSGLQLLSPSLQQGLRATTANLAAISNQLEDLRATTTATKKTAVFDFDSFTLEAVRRRHDQFDRPPTSSGSFLNAASSSGGSPRSPSLSRASTRFGKTASYDRLTSLDATETHSVRSADDYEWGSHRGTHVSYAQSVSSNNSSRYPVHHMSHLSGLSKRMSMASSTTSSAHPNGRMQHRAEVVVRGWLQRRRGRVLKRWKAQYCVLKTDQKLCLYSNEDTVNGRLEGRFQLLRVTYNEKNSSFQVIGIGSNETPYKEEFRPLDDEGWRAWFQALREFFDAASLHDALDKMPELSLVPGVHSSLLEDDDDDEDDGVFAQEVEEMIMRPYAYGSGSASTSNTSSTTTSSGNLQSLRQSQLHRAGIPEAPPSERRKTILFDPEEIRYTNTVVADADIPTDDELRQSGSPLSRASHRLINTSSSRSKSSSIASISSNGSVGVGLRRAPSSILSEGVAVDCPMIERDSQNPLAILEGRGSESAVSSSSGDGAFSWNRP